MANQPDEKGAPQASEPKKSTPVADDSMDELGPDGDDLDREGEQKEPRRRSRERRRRFDSVEDLIVVELKERARDADAKLRTLLTGAILIKMRDSSDSYVFDWSTDSLTTARGPHTSPDCTITIGQGDLFRIASGELNPQLAILAGNILVAGRLELAIYFFNLVVPYVAN